MMAQSNSRYTRCFLCHKRSRNMHNLESICPASNNSVYKILLYLGRCCNSIVHIPRRANICLLCHEKVADYDSNLVTVLQKQSTLLKLLENTVLSVDSDIELECKQHMADMDELTKEQSLDGCISDSEIQQAMAEAMPTFNREVACEYNEARQRYNGSVLSCSFCASRFKNKTQLQKHITFAHKKFVCNLCNYSHRNEDYVKLHMNLHEGKSENQCRFCDKTFTTKMSTIRHMEVHLDSKKYQCDKCGICFSQTTVLYNHRLQHEAEEQPLRCDICSQIFKTKRTFRHHMITHRVDRPRYSCEICFRTFTEKYTLKVHKRCHSVETEYPSPHQKTTLTYDITNTLSCIICDQVFASKDQLNNHMEKDHDVIVQSITVKNYEILSNDARVLEGLIPS